MTFADPSLAEVVRTLPWWPTVQRLHAEWSTGSEPLIEWVYGRPDVTTESTMAVISSGRLRGSEVVELARGLQAAYPRIVQDEIAAIRGRNLLRTLVVLADARDENRFETQFVMELDDDGRLVRQGTFDHHDEAAAQALLEAWHEEGPEGR